jgi:hypothetical protein
MELIPSESNYRLYTTSSLLDASDDRKTTTDLPALYTHIFDPAKMQAASDSGGRATRDQDGL